MEEAKSKRTAESSREKSKKKNAQEKRKRSDTTAFSSCSSVTDVSLESIMVVGKGCSYIKPKQHEFRLHECYSETAIPQSDYSKALRDGLQGEKLQTIPSNSSFTSAKSDFSDAYQKQIHDLEEGLLNQNLLLHSMRKHFGSKDLTRCKSASTETEESLTGSEDLKLKLKELEKKVSSKEKKIKELTHKLEECTKAKDAQIQENRGLNHKVSLLHRQLQSMFELLGKKNWNSPQPTESQSKLNVELEAVVAAQNEEKKQLSEAIEVLTLKLKEKEKEVSVISRELVEYKNKSTLEMCKLINQIDSLQQEAKNQSEVLESRISEAQTSMEDEIVNITLKLEEQYQKDVNSAIEKFHADFVRLADLPRRAIEQLLQLCEPSRIDFISYQKEWDKQQSELEAKIEALQVENNKNVLQLKDTYESKVMFLKTQVEVLSSQLKERKEIIDIFESELTAYKSNSSMNLLKAAALGDDFSALKELYTAEIFSQKQVHDLQLNVFDEKVKTLTEEILYLAKKEELRANELENAKQLATAFREKYEQLVLDWEGKVERDFNSSSQNVEGCEESQEFNMAGECLGLIQLLKKTEEAHEEKIKILEVQSEQEKMILLKDIEEFKSRLESLTEYHNIQKNMDETVHDLIKAVGKNYTEAMETLFRSHVTELSFKQMEMCATEKRHIEEIDELKNEHEKEVEDLRKRIEYLESTNTLMEREMMECSKTEELEAWRKESEEMATKYLKAEGIIAMKEETEKALSERIKELEEALRLKEENCRKELENLMAEYLKTKVISSAKEDLAKEMEEKLDLFEGLLDKSCEEVDRLTHICTSVIRKESGEIFSEGDSSGIGDKFQQVKEISGRLKVKLFDTFEDLEIRKKAESEEEETKISLKLANDRNEVLERENDQIMKENGQMKKEISDLVESICEKEKALAEVQAKVDALPGLKLKLEMIETERDEILRREEENYQEKERLLEKNSALEATVKELNERIDDMMVVESAKVWEEEDQEEMVSINLQEVQFLFEEEIGEATTVAAIACQTECDDERETSFQEGIFSQFKKIQQEFSDVVNERNELLSLLDNLERERNKLKQELLNLQEENSSMRDKFESCTSVLSERNKSGMAEMNSEIVKLSSCVKTLNQKLDVIKASNDFLLTKSQESFKHNQDLMNELEEAWSQRYEIEDQLAKVRNENTLLNEHKKQLEDTNKRISTMLIEGKPSVVSWNKLHETVENIVEEVLSLKTSVNESDSEARSSTSGTNPTRKNEPNAMENTVNAQLKNRATLCEELLLQKQTLERELTNLEKLLHKSETRLISRQYGPCRSRKRFLEMQSRQPSECSLETPQPLECEGPEEVWESSGVMPPNMFNMHLADRVMAEEQFCENWDQEPKMQNPEKHAGGEKDVPLDECLKTLELRYEEEVLELSKEFEREVEKLREAFGSEKEEDVRRETYEKEIDKLKNYFQKKWEDLEKRYVEMYKGKKRKDFNSNLELNDILEQFLAILREESSEEKQKSRVEKLLRDVVNRRDEEVNSLRHEYQKAVAMLKAKHDSEVQQLQAVVLHLKESIMTALDVEGGEEKESLIEGIRAEYEAKLEEEKKRLCDMLEDARQKHEKELAALEEFWTEKLSECETRCALVKAAGGRRSSQQERETDKTKIEQSLSERGVCPGREKQVAKYREGIQDLGIEQESLQDSLCVSCLTNQSFLERMEMKTDDDKLDVKQQRDTLEEMILSMRNIVSKLLTFIGHHNPELNATIQFGDETLYKTIQLDLDKTNLDESVAALELSTIFQEIKDNSLLSSSDQVRVELERCLKQLKTDATSLLALSCPETNVRSLKEMVRRVEREKNKLEAKVVKVEEMQDEMKKEMITTRERLSQWERNLEVVSEGYGEEVIEPKQTVSLSDLKGKLLKNCPQGQQDLNLMEEICKEGERLQEEWLKEKCDLQQQIDVADKQLHSLKKFMEEQALEREQEREAFDREINNLQENLRARERDSSIQNRTNREVEALASQVKDLTARLTETEKNKVTVEGEFQNAVKKIWSLREVIQELEVQLADVSERENNLKKKLEKMDGLLEEQSKANRNFKEELEACRSQNELKYSEHIKCLEEELIGLRHVAEQVNPESLNQLKTSLRQIEATLIKKTKDLEQLHVSSANVSCSSPSEDVSIRDHLDATRCSTPDEMCSNGHPLSAVLPMEEIDRVHEKLIRHTRAEEVAMKYIQDLKMHIRSHRKAFEEVQTERDVLLDKVDVYLKENSSLKVRLEEQRCNAGLLQKQLNANLESQVSRLEVDVEKLNEMCQEKDKQLREMKQVLENTTKTLKVKETEALNKSREVNTLITTLKTDLANALEENVKLEERLESTMEKLKDTMKMPALIESMIEEKNAEIDRLEKEVARLSIERTTSGISSRSYSSEEKQKRRIRFSEPDSFSENISSISVHCHSDLRNCSNESFMDLKSSFKGRRPFGCSTKLDSISSIAPLQLSPRGGDSFSWKASSPIVPPEPLNITPAKTSPQKPDLQQLEEMSKLQGSIDAKQREISELHLEIDILKRQLVEVNQEVATAKCRSKLIQDDLTAKEEEIEKLKNKEENLLAAMESLKTKHEEEVEELENKLKFERGKVEKIYEEIKTLEGKKVEIEEAFLSLKEDYKEKIEGEKKAAEALFQRIEMLEARNEESELKSTALEKELENAIRESEKTIQTLMEEITDLKKENDKNQLISSQKENAETQVGEEFCFCQNGLTLEIPQVEGCAESFKENLDELKGEFEKLAAVLAERDFNKREAFSYAMAVRRLLTVVLARLDELSKEVEAQMKKVMECSVDDLAVKVQNELVLSAKLDNQLLSSIKANGFASKEATPQPDLFDFPDNTYREIGEGDNQFVGPKMQEDDAIKVSGLYNEVKLKLDELMQAKGKLEGKISEQRNVIRGLEEKLENEKQWIIEEKKRCSEDAKIMELLRVNWEKALHDLKTKDRELKKEKQTRMGLEKELDSWRRQEGKDRENKKIVELNVQMETQKEKLASMGRALEEEKKKNQEAKLALEECQIERMSEKNAQRLMESDLSLLREQKEKYKSELLNARKLVHARNVEIGLLKRKINLQEIDIKALALSSCFHQQYPSETSSQASNAVGLPDFAFESTLMSKMKKLNTCLQRHVRESTEMEEALTYLGQETEQMREIIKKMEDNNETKLADETLVSDVEVEKKLWALEKERLVMDLETLQRENEALRRDLVLTCKNEDALREENAKLKKAQQPGKPPTGLGDVCFRFNLENNFMQDRISYLTRKYMRTESYRKALAWQKNYLMKNLLDYQRTEEDTLRRWGGRRKTNRKKRTNRFRVVATVVIAIFRMRFIVKRWHPNTPFLTIANLESLESRATLPTSLCTYNEPVDPLSYQTQNIIRQPQSQVLRTPPCRDPGPRAFSLDSWKLPDVCDQNKRLQRNTPAL